MHTRSGNRRRAARYPWRSRARGQPRGSLRREERTREHGENQEHRRGQGNPGPKPYGGGVAARAQGVRDRQHVGHNHEPVDAAPKARADPPADVEAQPENRGQIPGNDSQSRPQGPVGEKERDRDFGQAPGAARRRPAGSVRCTAMNTSAVHGRLPVDCAQARIARDPARHRQARGRRRWSPAPAP